MVRGALFSVGLQMLCWRTFPRRNLLNSTRCSYPIRHSRRRHSPGCGMPRQHPSPTMCGHCSIGSGASARSVSHRRLPGGSICTFKQGRIADRSAEAQQFRASGLNLVIAAIVFWNSTYIADAIAHLRTTEQSVPDAWLAHTSPLSWEHISFSGDFLRERAAATADKRRPLNLGQTRAAA